MTIVPQVNIFKTEHQVPSLSFIYLKSKRIDAGKNIIEYQQYNVVTIPVLIYDNGRSLYGMPCS